MRTTMLPRCLLANTLAAVVLAGLAIGVTVSAQERDRYGGADAVEIERPAPPQLLLVRFHADWCRACRDLGSTFKELQNRHESAPVLFVTLDLTDTASRRQAEFLAAALGLDDAWIRSGLRTGQMMLVSAKTGQVARSIASDLPLEDADRLIRSHLSTPVR